MLRSKTAMLSAVAPRPLTSLTNGATLAEFRRGPGPTATISARSTRTISTALHLHRPCSTTPSSAAPSTSPSRLGPACRPRTDLQECSLERVNATDHHAGPSFRAPGLLAFDVSLVIAPLTGAYRACAPSTPHTPGHSPQSLPGAGAAAAMVSGWLQNHPAWLSTNSTTCSATAA